MTGSTTTSCSSAPTRVLSRLFLFLALSFLSTLTTGAGNSLFGNSNGFLPVDEALPFSFAADNGAVVLSWDIAPDHYLYQERISVSSNTEGVELGEPEFSYTGTDTEDEFFGKVTVFYKPVEARIPVKLPEGLREAELQVTYQGCASAGLCYPPRPGTCSTTPAPATAQIQQQPAAQGAPSHPAAVSSRRKTLPRQQVWRASSPISPLWSLPACFCYWGWG